MSAPDDLSKLRRAAIALDKVQKRIDQLESARSEPIAVIGAGCRFPGASSLEAYWSLLRDGRNAVSEVPPDRWDIDAYYDPDPGATGRMYTRYGGFIDQVDSFDAQFFGIAPREAISMDPQQRLLLEVTWEAIENAGLPPDRLAGSRTGVFMGIFSNDYYYLQMRGGDAHIDAYTGTGNTASVAAGRLSYILGLQGPNMAIDTACSSSLVAVHLASQSLRSGESDLALAGGVNLILSPGPDNLLLQIASDGGGRPLQGLRCGCRRLRARRRLRRRRVETPLGCAAGSRSGDGGDPRYGDQPGRPQQWTDRSERARTRGGDPSGHRGCALAVARCELCRSSRYGHSRSAILSRLEHSRLRWGPGARTATS
jgi:hypothetical protein